MGWCGYGAVWLWGGAVMGRCGYGAVWLWDYGVVRLWGGAAMGLCGYMVMGRCGYGAVQLQDPSPANEEGITALHNAICGANRAVTEFLIHCGADVNAADSHGWTPLHCAASCNDTAICVALVRHGAALYATTHSDGCTAAEKCDPYREGYAECHGYLSEAEQSLGQRHGGVVYALWDFEATQGDEISFREGEALTVLRRNPPGGDGEWWWGALRGNEGFVPRCFFGLFPRVRPQWKK